MEAYLIKSNICLMVMYILYLSILRSETNHQLNRFSILSSVVFSFGFVFIPLNFFNAAEWPPIVQSVVQISSSLQDELTVTTSDNSTNIYFIIYVMGLVVLSLRTINGFYLLIRLYYKASKYEDREFKIVSVNEKISPFTFFNLLFLGNHHLKESEIMTLIIHEKCHRDHYHSVDVLMLEFLTVIFWFNPIIWLFQKEMRIQHEYQADECVIKSGVEPIDYQGLLFRSITGVSPQISNAFNKISLTKRFKMMKNRKKPSKMDYFKAALILPAMLLILTGAGLIPADEVGQRIKGSLSETAVGLTPEVSFEIFVDDSKVDLEKGIPVSTAKFQIRATPKENVLYAFRVSDVEVALVSKGTAKSKIRSGGQVDMEGFVSLANRGDYLVINVNEYQSRNKQKQIETIKLEKPFYINLPLY